MDVKPVNTNMEWPKIIRQLFQRAEPYLNARGDTRHAAISHRYSLYLMKHEGGDHKIIEPAVILHDVGWSCLNPQELSIAYGVHAKGEEANRLNRIHETEGAAIARNILAGMGFDDDLIKKISVIINRHDSGKSAYSMEEKVVRDADKLWRYSKIGFWTEIERQRLTLDELYHHLARHHRSWFFTPTALMLSQEKLSQRFKEIEARKNKKQE
jgi:HD superfamily phosphohydrolase YqeK